MVPQPPAVRTAFLRPWMLQVAHEARDPWPPGRATTTQQEALLQAETDIEEWRMGAPRTLTRVMHFIGWVAWLVVHEHWRTYLLPMLGRAGLDMRPFADA
eukprot:14295066-Alexandrium_andersonii.AAC.1